MATKLPPRGFDGCPTGLPPVPEAGSFPPQYLGVSSSRTLYFQGSCIPLCLSSPRPAIILSLIMIFPGVPFYLRYRGGSTQLFYILPRFAHPWDSAALLSRLASCCAACSPGHACPSASPWHQLPHSSHISSHSRKKLWNQIPFRGLRTPRHSSYFSKSLTFMNSYKEHMYSSVSVILVFWTLFECKLFGFRLCVLWGLLILLTYMGLVKCYLGNFFPVCVAWWSINWTYECPIKNNVSFCSLSLHG